jgi:hypothetical protein
MSDSRLAGIAFRILVTAVLVSTVCADCQQPTSRSSTADIEALIDQLRLYPWKGPENFTRPIHWVFNFTDPMRKILEIGPQAQTLLLHHLKEEAIKDQVIILLGGVGNLRSIMPIIDAMADGNEQMSNAAAKKTNLAANLALTNITAAEVIWHRGGGIPLENCPDDPQSCWSAWWKRNKNHIQKETAVNRNYSNYPNYGIYQLRENH